MEGADNVGVGGVGVGGKRLLSLAFPSLVQGQEGGWGRVQGRGHSLLVPLPLPAPENPSAHALASDIKNNSNCHDVAS